MATFRHREETVNTYLAMVISKLGVSADAEVILSKGAERPDVLFNMRGLRVAIEGKFADNSNAEKEVFEQSKGRVDRGIAHITVGVIYPNNLRITPTNELENALTSTEFKFIIVSESGESIWLAGPVAELMATIRRVQESLAQDDIVQQTAESLSEQLINISFLWAGQKGACDRLSELLGISIPIKEEDDQAELRQETAAKVSALVLANALIFQEQLSSADSRITPLSRLQGEADVLSKAGEHWQWIWKNINYVPIFQLAENIQKELPVNQNTISAFKRLVEEAKNICMNQAALRHDLMGRIYHWLLHEAKNLGTYYTSVSAATLLMKLTFAEDWEVDFSDPADLVSFKVGDMACGTGTLLMASAQAIGDQYIGLRSENGKSLNPVDLQTLHRTLMENILHGYDVLPSAVHLTASTLALLAPEVAFVRMNLFVMPLGLDNNIPKLGSLDFLGTERVQTQIALDYSQSEAYRTAASGSHITSADLPKLNLCVMNPPFVRSVGGNLLFGSLPDDRGRLQTELKERVKDLDLDANINVGLGSVFLAMANQHLKEGGRIAFILPAALISGEAWSKSRALLADKYHLETVVVSHDAERPNFSENTDLSETLFIARKLKANEKSGPTRFINLWRNPRTIHQAMDMANQINLTTPVSVESKGMASIKLAGKKVAEIFSSPPIQVSPYNWTGALFAQTELFRIFYNLKSHALRLPGVAQMYSVPLVALNTLGGLGYDRRDLHDGFIPSTEDWSPYPAFWGHVAKNVTQISQKPNTHLIVRTEAAKGRKLKDAVQMWTKSGKILLAERLRTNSHHLVAVGFESETVGNTWWAFRGDGLTDQQYKALLLWLNSSISILLFYGHRVITEGAWMSMKKPGWLNMPVLNVKELTPSQLSKLETLYDEISCSKIATICNLDSDETRIRLDKTLLEILELPDVGQIRALLAREPGLTGKPTLC